MSLELGVVLPVGDDPGGDGGGGGVDGGGDGGGEGGFSNTTLFSAGLVTWAAGILAAASWVLMFVSVNAERTVLALASCVFTIFTSTELEAASRLRRRAESCVTVIYNLQESQTTGTAVDEPH